jgi:hypothetical protein
MFGFNGLHEKSQAALLTPPDGGARIEMRVEIQSRCA